jgi:hypothetical protein
LFQIATVKELFRLTRDDELKEAEDKYLPKQKPQDLPPKN